MIDPYAMPSGVLRNKLGITDPQLLATAEADITRARLIQLTEHPLPGDYDLNHLQAIHAAIFGDIYPWAGELRSVDIAKTTPFCPARNLLPYAEEMFGRLKASDHLRGLPRERFISELAAFYGDLNALHPFREGNGRAQRAFTAQLARGAGYLLSWAGLDARRNEAASIRSFVGDNGPLEELLDELTTEAA